MQNSSQNQVLQLILNTIKLKQGKNIKRINIPEFLLQFILIRGKLHKKWVINEYKKDQNDQIQVWHNFLQKIAETNIHTFIIHVKSIQKNFFSKSMLEIKFVNLKILDLEYCNMATMEIITLLDVPRLKFLYISDNKLVNVRSLIKCFAIDPVQLVNYNQNKIISMNDRQIMRRINFNYRENKEYTGKFRFQCFDKQSQVNSGNLCLDPIFFVPFHLKKMKTLSVSNYIMKNQQIKSMMKKIFCASEIVIYNPLLSDFFCSFYKQKYEDQCLNIQGQ